MPSLTLLLYSYQLYLFIYEVLYPWASSSGRPPWVWFGNWLGQGQRQIGIEDRCDSRNLIKLDKGTEVKPSIVAHTCNLNTPKAEAE